MSASAPAASSSKSGSKDAACPFRIPSSVSPLVSHASAKRSAGEMAADAERLRPESQWNRKKRLTKKEGKEEQKRQRRGEPSASTSNENDAAMDVTSSSSVEPSSSSAIRLFFQGMVRGVDRATIRKMTEASWSYDPELTMQILMHGRDARDGKGEKAVVIEALLWLRQEKPRTYVRNLLEMLRLGYFKDLLQLATGVVDRGLPWLGLSSHAPIELEILAEFLKADRATLEKFRAKTTSASSTDETNNMADEFELMTAPSKATLAAAASPAGAASASASSSSSAPSAAESRDLLKIDLCFVIDSTGSMGPWLEQAKSTVRELVSQLGKECERSGVKRTKIRLSLLAYQDYFDRDPFDVQPFTEDIEVFTKVLNKLTPRGGADLPEDMIRGLEKALAFEWDDSADTRMMILIADAPCHGEEFSQHDSPESKKFLAGHPEDPKGVIQQIRDRNIHFAFTRITDSTDVMLEKFQGWYDNRKTRRCLNVLQLGQQVQRFLPQVMDQVTLATLGRLPELVLPSVAAAAAEDELEDGEIVEVDDAAGDQPNQPKKKKVKKAPTAQLSLAGKWAPTEGSHFDQAPYKFASHLSTLLFPSSKCPARDYRKLCSALRSELQVVERLMCTQQWSSIEFASVPSRCHMLMKKVFMKHQAVRYAEYQGKLKRGEVTIKSAGLQPHELTQAYRTMMHPLKVDDTTEAQWKTMVEKLRKELAEPKKGESESVKPLRALTMIDTSGSMTWNMQLGAGSTKNVDNKMSSVAPIDAAIALTLLISELTEGPFKDRVLTFSERPNWLRLPNSSNSSLCERVDTIYSQAENGGSTNIVTALEMILEVAVSNHCKPSDLPNALFVLSDMDLQDATDKSKLNLDIWRHNYAEAGFVLPDIVLWNLSARTAGKAASGEMPSELVPGVTLGSVGVTMISGYSASLVKVVLRQDLKVDPLVTLMQTVAPYTRVEIEQEER